MATTCNIYAIKDNQTPCYAQLFFSQSDAVATRVCAGLLRDDTQLSMFSEHFDLFRLATVDQDSGKITPEAQGPLFLCGLVTIKNMMKKETQNNEPTK